MESIGLKEKEQLEKVFGYQMTDKELEAYAFHFERIRFAKNQRDKHYKEFDDLTYEQDYYSNEEARNTYLRPKMNDGEVRIATGTTEKKIEFVLNELISLNLQPEVIAFDDEDLEISSLGKDFTDIVSRTNEIEHDDDFWIEAVHELLTQRAVFIEEFYNDGIVMDRKFGKKIKGIKRQTQRAEKHLLNGLQVFLGDITIPAYRFQEQPFIVTYDRMIYQNAKRIFGTCKNFKYVKPGANGNPWYSGTYKFKFSELNSQEVDIVKYMDYPNDEYQVYVNGIPMYDVGEALPWEYEGYNIDMFVLKPMNRNFAYGKPLTASAKTLQALNNESIRLLIRKFRQAIEPPTGVTSGKIYSKNIFDPGSLVQGVNKDEFSPLINHQGVTPSEMQMFTLIEQKAEEFIGTSNLQTNLAGKKLTATQTIELQKVAAKQLGLAVMAVMRMKRNLTLMRINTVLENYTQPVSKMYDEFSNSLKDKFRSFTIQNSEFDDNKMGKKVINFSDQDLSHQDRWDLMEYEDFSANIGKPLRIVNINVDKLRSIPINWFVAVSPKDRVGSALKKVMFTDKLNQGSLITQLTGKTMNPDKVTEEFEREWNCKGFFSSNQPQMQGEQQGGDEKAQVTEAGKNLLSTLKSSGGARKPGAKELLNESPGSADIMGQANPALA